MQELLEIQKFVESIARGDEEVKPGMPLRFTEASTVNDRIWQGDLAITIAEDSVPEGYVKQENVNLQLVPGNNIGSKHCLDSADGVECWLPENFDETSLNGPFLRLSCERTVTHPVHGDVTIPSNFCVNISYQREYDLEQARERRARD